MNNSNQNIGLFTISSFDLIPMCKHIIHYYDKLNCHIMISHCSVSQIMQYNIQDNPLKVFENRIRFNNQKRVFKVSKYIKTAYRLLIYFMSKKTSVIYCIELPTLNFALFLKKLFAKKNFCIVYHQFEMLDPMYFSKFDKFNILVFKKLKNSLNLFVAPEQNRINYFCETCNFPISKSFLLPNSTLDVKIIDEKYNKLDPVVIGHIGIAGKSGYINEFMTSIALVSKKLPIQVLFVGHISDEVKKLINSYSHLDTKIVGDISHEELFGYYRKIDVGVILYKDVSINYRYCAPNKLYEYWAHGIPVIAHKLEGLKNEFKIKDQGVLCNMDSREDLTSSIFNLVYNINYDTRLNLKKYFNTYLSLPNYLDSLAIRTFMK